MKLLADNSGIAFAMVYIMMTLIMVAGIWISSGVVIDEYNTLASDLPTDSIWGSSTTNSINELTNVWNLILWLTVGCSFIYALVTAIRKEKGGSIND